jgi:UDP-N-acetyl-D-galactosamine dehydrogenase
VNILEELKNLKITSDINDLINSDVYIITVPTPIDKSKRPNLNLVRSAILKICESVNESLEQNQNNYRNDNYFTVILESTVYPGVCEDICIPLIEKETNLKINSDFIFGYSPERINPGDKEHKLDTIIKVTSGSNQEGTLWIDNLYKSIIKAGTFQAKNIKTAEAAKVIENIQRDLNISLINELMIIFNKLNINIFDVLKCSETKWNFLKFKPGLVGGHCIGVDPYYLTFISEEIGYSPKVITAGRKINDEMSIWFTQEIIKKISKEGFTIKDLEILIMGFTFKENCPDYRNTKVLDMYNELISYGAKPIIYDPLVDVKQVKENLKLEIIKNEELYSKKYKVIVVTLAHDILKRMTSEEWEKLKFSNTLIFDLKNFIGDSINTINF